ncbi:MAG: integrin [Deltaproteobacteria bacterium]|nr:integrin [Deltaproteobacteria bacterium]
MEVEIASTGADGESEDGATADGATADETTSGAEPSCGNGVVEDGEECDGDDSPADSCDVLGLEPGPLSCRSDCTYDVTRCGAVPAAPVMQLRFASIKRFEFTWDAVRGADYYRLEESFAPGEPLVQLGEDITGLSVSFEMPLHVRWGARYRLLACNAAGCTSSELAEVTDSLVSAVGYVKASNTEAGDGFGHEVAISEDGNTLAVGAVRESSGSTGSNGAQDDNSLEHSGAVYVFVRDGLGSWTQQAYLKASNPGAFDEFGYSVTLSDDGNTLAVGARFDVQTNGTERDGAAYVFERDALGAWSQSAYLKGENTEITDEFGANTALSGDGDTLIVAAHRQLDVMTLSRGVVYVFGRDGNGGWVQQQRLMTSHQGFFGSSVAVSDDGNTIAAGAFAEDSGATGVGGDQNDTSAEASGAAYIYTRDDVGAWSQQAYIKASNTDAGDYFGYAVALSGDGEILAVSASHEGSNATGVGGNQDDDSASESGAVYIYSLGGAWSQQAYIKASNTGAGDEFGHNIAMSDDGQMLAVGALLEGGGGVGHGGDQTDDSLSATGAVYVFENNGQWSQRSYLKAPNTDEGDAFGFTLALSGSGETLVVGTPSEDSNATGVGGDQLDNSVAGAGAVYLY